MTGQATETKAEHLSKTIDALDVETRSTLAVLHDAPKGVAELAIATLGYWIRVLLVETSVIEPFEDDESPDRGTDAAMARPVAVTLTNFGRAVLAECAELVGADPALEERLAELRQAHERYRAADGIERKADREYHTVS